MFGWIPTQVLSMDIKNFGANVKFHPESYHTPSSAADVLDILRSCRGRGIRVVGRLHSWSEAPRGDDVVLSLARLNEVHLEERDDGTWAIIGAGCQIKDVVKQLDRAGLALPSLGLITEQSMAGAISTGTHGSGKHSLSHYADTVTVATYDQATGEPVIRTIDDGDELRAARCALGCMGVILSVSIHCRRQYYVQEVLRLADDVEDVLSAEEAYPLQQSFFLPHLNKYLLQQRREVAGPRSWLAPLYHIYWFLGVDVGLHLMLLTITRLFRSRKLVRFFFRYVVLWTTIRGWRATDKSQHILTMEHELFRHIEIEVFVERSQLVAAMQFIRQLLAHCDGSEKAIDAPTWDRLDEVGAGEAARALQDKYTHHYPICIRKVLPDATLISMTAGDDEARYAISFISYHRPTDRESFFAFADLLAHATAQLFDARPHWGKVCPIDAALAERLYPRLPEFRQCCEAADPQGIFRNGWVNAVIFGQTAGG